ncbi:MAG: hypothetical protein BWY85_00119 [Firmicutes bacterium ADurb.Bin506]|nr:MAG: hypothetical protein BWY85_00119 [Firmicutes bacterium ADurb.Bin506]
MSIAVFVLLSAFEEIPNELPPFNINEKVDPAYAHRPHRDEVALERLFRLLNHVLPDDAARMPTGGKHRALSVGDVITFVEGDDKRIWLCAPLGWRRINMEFLVEYEKLSLDDRMRRVRQIA